MKKKILFLLHLPPPVHGSSMVGKFIKDSKTINDSFSGRYINLLASKSLNSTGRFSFQKLIIFFKTYFKIGIELSKKPDLCYLALTATGLAFYRDTLIVALLKLFGVKPVYHLHNKGIRKSSNNIFHHYFYRFVFKNARVILLSEYLYNDVSQYVSKDRICICPNGIPDSSSGNKKPKSDNTTVKILYFSNLIKTKGVYVLIDACSILKSKGIEFECDFVGGEGDITKTEFEKRVEERGLSNCVRYLGKKYNSEKERIFSEADIFAFPTFYPNECFPLVIIEAMQNTLPVISTDEGGINDLVLDEQTGYIIPQNDKKALAGKIESLINSKDLRLKMGMSGYERYKKNFTLEKFEQNLNSCLQSVH